MKMVKSVLVMVGAIATVMACSAQEVSLINDMPNMTITPNYLDISGRPGVGAVATGNELPFEMKMTPVSKSLQIVVSEAGKEKHYKISITYPRNPEQRNIIMLSEIVDDKKYSKDQPPRLDLGDGIVVEYLV